MSILILMYYGFPYPILLPNQSLTEVQGILSELRDLKAKLRAAGILAK
ncbi:hypothetical protein M2419_000045 [Sphingobacterium sp. BIGb0116]|nr:hypothetical protein [Sphingobacterium sp. BIGb0116]